MRVLQESLRVLSPNRRLFVTIASLNSKMLQLILDFNDFVQMGHSFLCIGRTMK